MPNIMITRAVARRLVDILDDLQIALVDDGKTEHPLVMRALNELFGALDIAQGDSPSTVEIEITGTDMDLPE